MEYPSLELVEKMLRSEDVCGSGASDADIAAGKILLFSAYVGENPEQLAIASGMELSRVQEMVGNLIDASVFGKGLDHAIYISDDKNSWMTLMLDICCAQGRMARGNPHPDGEPTWKMSEDGIRYVEKDLMEHSPAAKELMDKLDEASGLPRGSTRKMLRKKLK